MAIPERLLIYIEVFQSEPEFLAVLYRIHRSSLEVVVNGGSTVYTVAQNVFLLSNLLTFSKGRKKGGEMPHPLINF